ncbi:MAG: zinc metallopeptidase [Halofilum sp. (in: g-proteobacteria)]|nr:zinc metallopeptidase [Halofilum sp. (in: g-proteobacteria)]
MHLLLPLLLVLAAVFGPGLWVRHVMRRYSEPDDRYPGTGADLVHHLAKRHGLTRLRVERTDQGDHYDPQAATVRLSPANHDGRSLTAITVAAHEFGHALQDNAGFRPLRWRTRLVRTTRHAERVGAALLVAAPFLGILTRVPAVGILTFVGGLLTLGASTLVHLVTLPTELDASFARALPILSRGGYLEPGDRPHARRILMAAALTYVSASLMSLLNVARWWALLRR